MRLGQFLLIMFFLILANLKAQASEGTLAIGLHGGLTFPDFHISESTIGDLYHDKNGWLAGAFLEFDLANIKLRPEVNYVTKGYTVGNVAEVKNHYLEVPVLIKFNPLAEFTLSPFVLLGPQWSQQLRSDLTTLSTTTSYSNTVDRWDVSVVGGLGLAFNILPSMGISVQGRYAYGFRDVDSSPAKIKNRTIYLISGLSIKDPF